MWAITPGIVDRIARPGGLLGGEVELRQHDGHHPDVVDRDLRTPDRLREVPMDELVQLGAATPHPLVDGDLPEALGTRVDVAEAGMSEPRDAPLVRPGVGDDLAGRAVEVAVVADLVVRLGDEPRRVLGRQGERPDRQHGRRQAGDHARVRRHRVAGGDGPGLEQRVVEHGVQHRVEHPGLARGRQSPTQEQEARGGERLTPDQLLEVVAPHEHGVLLEATDLRPPVRVVGGHRPDAPASPSRASATSSCKISLVPSPIAISGASR